MARAAAFDLAALQHFLDARNQVLQAVTISNGECIKADYFFLDVDHSRFEPAHPFFEPDHSFLNAGYSSFHAGNFLAYLGFKANQLLVEMTDLVLQAAYALIQMTKPIAQQGFDNIKAASHFCLDITKLAGVCGGEVFKLRSNIPPIVVGVVLEFAQLVADRLQVSRRQLQIDRLGHDREILAQLSDDEQSTVPQHRSTKPRRYLAAASIDTGHIENAAFMHRCAETPARFTRG